MDLGLSGKACIVTGATSGIGLATANALRAEGAQVLGVARRDADFEADVTEPAAGERIVAECERRFGAVDVLVNNAGTSEVKPLDELADDDWQSQWELNVMAAMRLMRAAITFSSHCDCQSSSDRKSTRLNSSHQIISYAVFCLKKKTHHGQRRPL